MVATIKTGERSKVMETEITKEKEMGRVVGPFDVQEVLSGGVVIDARAAKAFPVRRADNWFHNATVWVSDSPLRASPDTLAACVAGAWARQSAWSGRWTTTELTKSNSKSSRVRSSHADLSGQVP